MMLATSSQTCDDIKVESIIKSLPHIPKKLVRQLNTLFRKGIFAAVEENSSTSNWRLSHGEACLRKWIKLKSADSILWLSYDSDQWRADVNEKNWCAFPEQHQILSFSIAHKNFLVHLDSLTTIPWEIHEVSNKLSLADNTLYTFSFTVENQGKVSTGIIALCHDTLGSLISNPVWQSAPLPRNQTITSIPITLSVEFRADPIRISELSEFNEGDILLCGEYSNLKENLALKDSPTNTIIAWLEEKNGEFVVVSNTKYKPELETLNQTEPTDNQGPDTVENRDQDIPLNSIKDLQITLDIQIGKIPSTIAELDDIEPGYLFKLPEEELNKRVSVIANGQPFARGEIVMIGDQMGIRITELA